MGGSEAEGRREGTGVGRAVNLARARSSNGSGCQELLQENFEVSNPKKEV